jgi:hypothetical protein
MKEILLANKKLKGNASAQADTQSKIVKKYVLS